MKITKLKNGQYSAVISLGSDITGKRVQKRITAASKWEVEKIAEEILSKKIDGTNRELTVQQAMTSYIESRSSVIEPTTLRGYRELARNRLIQIHGIKIKNLTTLMIQMAINQEAARGVSRRTIKNGVDLLKASLQFFDIMLNFKKLQLPKNRPQGNEVLPELTDVFSALQGSSIEVYCALALNGCMRIGEVLGLKFSDVDFENCRIHIHRTQIMTEDGIQYRDYCKTPQSNRMITITPELCAQIRNLPHKSMDEYIVPMSRKALYSRYARIMKKHGLPTSFHLIRKMSASALHAAGMPDKYILYLGGWSTDNVLKTVYQKTFESEREVANRQAMACFQQISEQIEDAVRRRNPGK